MTVAADSMHEQPRPGHDAAVSRGGAAFKGVFSVLDQAVVSGTSFATIVLVGRLCSREDLGLYALALSIVMFIRGAQGEIVNSPFVVYSNRREGEALASYTGSTLILHLCLTAAGVVFLAGLALVFGLGLGPANLAPVLGVLVGALPFLLLREFIRQLTLSRLDAAAVLALDAGVAGLQLASLLLIAGLQLLTVGAAYAVMGGACAVASLAWFLRSRPRLRIDPPRLAADWRHNWLFGRWALAGFLVGSTMPYAVPWIVAAAHGTAATGMWAACNSLANLAGTYVTGMTNVLTPRAARAFACGGPEELRRVLRRTGLLFAISLGAFCLVILLTGDLAVRLVYRDQYAETGPVLALLALTVLVNSLGITAGNGLWALDEPRANFAADLCTLLVTVAAVFALVGPLGVLGAALAVLAGAFAGAGLRCLTLRRRLKALDYQPEAA